MLKCKLQCGLSSENLDQQMKHLRNSMLKLCHIRSRSRILSNLVESISKLVPSVFPNWTTTFNPPMNKWRQMLSTLTLLNRIWSLKMIFIIKYQDSQSCTQIWISMSLIRYQLSIREVLASLSQERKDTNSVLVPPPIKSLTHQALKMFAGYVLEKRKKGKIMN